MDYQLPSFCIHTEISISDPYTDTCISKRYSTGLSLSFLLYTEAACEIDNPEGLNAQHLARPSAIALWQKNPKNSKHTLQTYILPEPGGCTLTTITTL